MKILRWFWAIVVAIAGILFAYLSFFRRRDYSLPAKPKTEKKEKELKRLLKREGKLRKEIEKIEENRKEVGIKLEKKLEKAKRKYEDEVSEIERDSDFSTAAKYISDFLKGDSSNDKK